MPGGRARESLWYAARISREDHRATVIRQALTCDLTARPSSPATL